MVPPHSSIAIDVQEADALTFKADLLALKYAQRHYGVDRAVADALRDCHPDLSDLLPKADGFRLIESRGSLVARLVLFVGVTALREFGYAEIRQFGRKVLVSLARGTQNIEHIALTLHGADFGLDESEAFASEIAGLMDAIVSGDIPHGLRRISIVERNPGRATRLHFLLSQLIPDGRISADGKEAVRSLGNSVNESLRSVGYASASKPYVFVAMSFADDMEDVFHYGSRSAVKDAGLLCERADQSSFTGDVLEWIKSRISTAFLVVADLSSANPNVYLEVGYAWGCGRPTVLIVANASDLKFDIRGQRCLVYNRKIKSLEEMLRLELLALQREWRGHGGG